jgi:hypothetical protein
MTDFTRMRELAALLRPPMAEPVVEDTRKVQSFDSIQSSVDATLDGFIGDLKHDIGEGGQLELLLNAKGLSKLADEHELFKSIDAEIDAFAKQVAEFKKKVGGLMMDAEGILISAE